MVKEPRFPEKVKEQQVEWRKTWDTRPSEGSHPHVLPPARWLDGVWCPIRNDLDNYISSNRIRPHEARNHLNSSWVNCANMYFPFREPARFGTAMQRFLSKLLDMKVSAITGMEFEYEAPGRLAPRSLLGENGTRGANQTSPDAGISFRTDTGKEGIYLVEHKFTEQDFEDCSANDERRDRKGRPVNHDKSRCENLGRVALKPREYCHQHHEKWGRKYWSLLGPHLAQGAELGRCPAIEGGYQLLRQQALAQGIADSRVFDLVIHGVSYDERNTQLLGCMEAVGLPSFVGDWSKLFDTNVRFVCFTHQQFVGFMHDKGSEPVKRWAEYMTERYDY